MFKSKLFIRYFSTIVIVIATFTAAIYFFSITFIKETIYEIEKSSAKTVLNNVYEIVHTIDHSMESYRESALAAKKRELKNVIMMAESYINIMEAQAKAGTISQGNVEKEILETLSNFKYGNNDYIFVTDYNSFILAHPDKSVLHTDCSKLADVTGKLVVYPIVEGALKYGEGYHTYKWKRLETGDEPLDKLTYYKNLPDRKWVLATGVYIDDIEKAMNSMKMSAIDNLRQILRDVKLAKTGYVFIFGAQGNGYYMTIHPIKAMESTNMKQYFDPVTKIPLYKELIAVADKPDGLRYKWDRPNDPGHYVYDKIAFVRYYKPFDWYIGSSVYVDELESSSRILGNRILAIAFLSLIFLVFLGYVFSKKMVAPLKMLAETALRIKGGDLTATITINRDDEIGILADAFNSMVGELKENIMSLDAKVNERTSELQAAYDKLKAVDEMKSAFLSNVSHELRTPLTSVLGFAEIIKQSFEETVMPHVNMESKKVERSAKRISENIEIIISESERLTALINDVLDITKMEAGKMVWKKDTIKIYQLINHAIRAISPLLRGKEALRFAVAMEENVPDTVGDYDRILQVVINLISNAVKFSKEGDITIRASSDDNNGEILVSVTDDGIGIPAEEQEMVFEKFKQIGDTLTDKPKGSGLGLPISKEIVEHHRGRIWVESEPGRGSIFSFTLPVVQAEAAPSA
ncbi:MAG: cache domain-containing protein [Nitrospirae bacterium]|nr:cache domain-containing protein [Nitrospirota bacterium]MBF0533710.1 cache domain-containing protein [Nitrospirota bacterium]MBF0615581.1 cache domain-containing protein [Nitrospirota bacterium]